MIKDNNDKKLAISTSNRPHFLNLQTTNTKKSIANVAEFNNRVDSYIDYCLTAGEPVTFSGLLLSLGIEDKETFCAYESDPKYRASVRRALLLVEYFYEIKLALGPSSSLLKGLGRINEIIDEKIESSSSSISNKLNLKKIERIIINSEVCNTNEK